MYVFGIKSFCGKLKYMKVLFPVSDFIKFVYLYYLVHTNKISFHFHFTSLIRC